MDYIVLDNGAVTVSQIPPPQSAPGVLRGATTRRYSTSVISPGLQLPSNQGSSGP